MLTVAEQRFLETVPRCLMDIVEQLRAVVKELKALNERLDKKDDTAV